MGNRASRLHILVVDDSSLLRVMLEQVCSKEHDVSEAASLGAAWRAYQEKKPDIVFTDISLPDGSGHELARRIKEQNPSAFVVMMTGSSRMEDKEDARQNKVDGYLVKPISKNDIMSFVERYKATRSSG